MRLAKASRPRRPANIAPEGPSVSTNLLHNFPGWVPHPIKRVPGTIPWSPIGRTTVFDGAVVPDPHAFDGYRALLREKGVTKMPEHAFRRVDNDLEVVANARREPWREGGQDSVQQSEKAPGGQRNTLNFRTLKPKARVGFQPSPTIADAQGTS